MGFLARWRARLPVLARYRQILQEIAASQGRRLCFRIVKAIRRFSVRTVLPEPIAALGELASNLRWSWHPATRDLFCDIDPKRWATVSEDPVAMLSALSADELRGLASNEVFVATVHAAARDLATYLRDRKSVV